MKKESKLRNILSALWGLIASVCVIVNLIVDPVELFTIVAILIAISLAYSYIVEPLIDMLAVKGDPTKDYWTRRKELKNKDNKNGTK